MKRYFLDRNRPLLHLAVDWIISHFVCEKRLDLRDVILALPVARAGMRLEEILLARVEKEIAAGALQTDWTPPRIVTIGNLPEDLYFVQRAEAEKLLQKIVWLQVIQETLKNNSSYFETVFHQVDKSLESLYDCGEILASLHRELASEKLDFAKVAEFCDKEKLPHEQHESARWDALAHLQKLYLDKLDALGYWDIQTARLKAIENKEIECSQQIVLVGMTDLNQTQKEIFSAAAREVIALVFAPESEKHLFDDAGCVVPNQWKNVTIPIRDEQMIITETQHEQAAKVANYLVERSGNFAANQVVIGIPDSEIVPLLVQKITQRGGVTQLIEGIPISRSSVVRILAATAAFLDSRNFADYAALMRIPECEKYIRLAGKISGDVDLLTALDRFHEKFLPTKIDNEFEWERKRGNSKKDDVPNMLELKLCWDKWKSLWGNFPQTENLFAAFAAPFREYLHAFFPADEELTRANNEAIKQVESVLAAWESLPLELTIDKIDSAMAIRFLLREVAGNKLTSHLTHDDQAIGLLGWLELPMDDSPLTIITGLSEGIVPSSNLSDMFLPDRMRERLGIDHNDRRYARDASSLLMIIQSRKNYLLTAARRTLDGSVRFSSRFFFATDDETLTARVQKFLKPTDENLEENAAPILQVSSENSDGFKVPPPEKLASRVTSMRVTEFKDYLACPYRYYLRHQKELTTLDDSAEEWNAGVFGTYIHAALNLFGKSKIKDSTTPETIYSFLETAFNELVREKMGNSLRPSLMIQVEQMKKRLLAFSDWQAKWAKQGYRIIETEIDAKDFGECKLSVDNSIMILCGRIDRIDFHEEKNELVIFDYKTGSSKTTPDKTHRSGDKWIDLQLPLYREMVSQWNLPEFKKAKEIKLGYILLPKDTTNTKEELAKWDKEALDSACETWEEVIRNIWAEKFFPPISPPPIYSEEFAAICLDNVL